MAKNLRDQLSYRPGTGVADYDPGATPGLKGGKAEAEAALAALGPALDGGSRRLFAHGKAGGRQRVLLVLQGMDTSGKSGIVRDALGLVDPYTVRVHGFKAPTAVERRHDFLWRVERALPPAGALGVFDRSHYEDVLIQRVRAFAPPEEIERRYGAINDFEAGLADEGYALIKCFLHISPEVQRQRLLERIDEPKKQWKYNPGDLDERWLWADYMKAYEIALQRCHTGVAPWHVIPSDNKWYRNWAVGKLLAETLADLELDWPAAEFDPEAERRRLLEEAPFER